MKAQTLTGWDKGSLTGKAKAVRASRAKGIDSLLPTAGRRSAAPVKLPTPVTDPKPGTVAAARVTINSVAPKPVQRVDCFLTVPGDQVLSIHIVLVFKSIPEKNRILDKKFPPQ